MDARRGRAAREAARGADVDIVARPDVVAARSTTRTRTSSSRRSIQPTIVYDWPIELSPFARTTDDDQTIVERFEYFVGGMEFATRSARSTTRRSRQQRFALQAGERAAGDVEAEQGDPDYVEALSYGMPPTSGIGIGIDRLAMLFTRQRRRSATSSSSRCCAAPS